MKIIYVCQKRVPLAALGAIVRRKGIIGGLRSHGLDVEVIELDRVVGRRPEMFSTGQISAEDRKILEGFLREGGKCVYFEGLPVAIGVYSTVKNFQNDNLFHLDLCDSWISSASLGQGSGRGLVPFAVRHLKKAAAALALHIISERVKSLSYISQLDLETDEKWLHPKSDRMVIGNSVDETSTNSMWRPSNIVLCIGDWGYSPNVIMLKNNIAWISGLIAAGNDLQLRVVGPNIPDDFNIPDFVDFLGWIEDIREAYIGVICSIALISEGAGVKNKVIESLANGIPVIGTQAAFASVPDVESMTLRTEIGGPSEEIFSSWLRRFESSPPEPIHFSTWRAMVDPLVDRISRH